MHELRSRFCFTTRVIPHIHLRTRHARRWFAKKRFCNRFVPSRYVLQGCKRRDHHRLLVLHSNMPPPRFLGEKRMHLQTKHARCRVSNFASRESASKTKFACGHQ